MDSSPRPSDTAPAKGQIPLRYLVADRSEAWSQTCSELKFGLSSRLLPANYRELAFLRQVRDQLRTCLRQDSVVEFGFNEGWHGFACHPHPQANNFNHVYAVPQISGSFRTRIYTVIFAQSTSACCWQQIYVIPNVSAVNSRLSASIEAGISYASLHSL